MDGKDRIIQQLENQRNTALTQAAQFGAQLESVHEKLQETDLEKNMLLLQKQADDLRIVGLEKDFADMKAKYEPAPAETDPVDTPAANDAAPATVAPVATGTEG